MSQSVLVIDDDPDIRELLQNLLQAEGLLVRTASTGQEGLASVQQQAPDLVVLDIDLPDLTGLVVCKKIRAFSKIPIIMLSAKGQELDKVVGMEFGADDYVAKPCNPKELVARVRAQLRRWSQWQTPTLHSGNLEARQATVLFALLSNEQAFENNRLEDLGRQLIEFQEIFEQVVTSRGGLVDSYSEDTAVATFAQGKADLFAADACRAAQILQHDFNDLSQEWRRQRLTPFQLGIGLHTGQILLGDVSLSGEHKPVLVGDEARKTATVARFAEKLTVPILASQSTTLFASSLNWNPKGEHCLKEGEAPVALFQLS